MFMINSVWSCGLQYDDTLMMTAQLTIQLTTPYASCYNITDNNNIHVICTVCSNILTEAPSTVLGTNIPKLLFVVGTEP